MFLFFASGRVSGRYYYDDSAGKAVEVSGLPQGMEDVTRKEGFIPFAYVGVKGTQKRIHPSKDFPKGPSYEAASIRDTGFLGKEIFSILGLNDTGSSLEQALLADKKKYLDSSNEQEEDGPPYESLTLLTVAWQDPRVLCLAMDNYNYTGGAHGLEGSSYYCYDLVRQARIRLTDVLDTFRYAEPIRGLLEKQFRRDGGSGLFQDTIPLTDNFYLTDRGICFDYPPYAIGPYALGSIEVFLPYKDLDLFLQPGFKRLISPGSPRYPR